MGRFVFEALAAQGTVTVYGNCDYLTNGTKGLGTDNQFVNSEEQSIVREEQFIVRKNIQKDEQSVICKLEDYFLKYFVEKRSRGTSAKALITIGLFLRAQECEDFIKWNAENNVEPTIEDEKDFSVVFNFNDGVYKVIVLHGVEHGRLEFTLCKEGNEVVNVKSNFHGLDNCGYFKNNERCFNGWNKDNGSPEVRGVVEHYLKDHKKTVNMIGSDIVNEYEKFAKKIIP